MFARRRRARPRGAVHRWPTRSFLLCGSERTGTSYLAALLASTGQAGLALERFDHRKAPGWADTDYRVYVASVLKLDERNGVFGAKLLWPHLMSVLPRLRAAAAPCTGVRSDRDLLAGFFPSVRYLWIRRADLVAQAVSWEKAEQTASWNSRDPVAATEPVFDFDTIDRLVLLAGLRNESWRAWFAANGIEAHPVLYEDLTADPVGETSGALDFLGRSVPKGVAIRTSLERQADEINADWIARYRRLRDERSPEPEGSATGRVSSRGCRETVRSRERP